MKKTNTSSKSTNFNDPFKDLKEKGYTGIKLARYLVHASKNRTLSLEEIFYIDSFLLEVN